MPLPRSGLAGVRLNPSGETTRDGGFAHGDAGLLQDDQENAGPERDAMDFASGPEVVRKMSSVS